ncbi:NADPH:quinone reductase-like Zn-dependent oxidoreductase [Ilumatobacter fluminis]|uniref:NADPH:quinone reductase-like Zn-dependent oxidoreductase n=1 Tax=Ilumatobacter fluminis TaxID=467091 RepID=A0A4R7I1P1_9ACTN|nr:zinc-binding dehydrogenase [Ilumatobacter fluminis]TDT17355.1 NADPH:quinone reductase-like Zn-dependent oxidoreductase [Ilumatobacter fluminis]
MRAQVQHGFASGADVRIVDVPVPVPGTGEVVIEVQACSLNRLDLLQQEAPLVRGFSVPHIAGLDVAGTVVRHGADVGAGGPAIGDTVIVNPVSSCGQCANCRAGFDPYCSDVRSIGSTRDGGFAEFVAVPAASCHAVPAGLDEIQAACLPVAYATAWRALVTAGGVAPGEWVLVNAATSGVSTALVQLAIAHGARVIGTAGGAAKIDHALGLGCEFVVDHYDDDVVARVMEWTGGRGVDLVVDHVGPALFEASIAALRPEGRMVFCGTTTGTDIEMSLPSVYHWGKSLIGSGGYSDDEFTEMLAFVEHHALEPVIDSVWPFDRIGDAQARMEAGRFFGKIVVTFESHGAVASSNGRMV